MTLWNYWNSKDFEILVIWFQNYFNKVDMAQTGKVVGWNSELIFILCGVLYIGYILHCQAPEVLFSILLSASLLLHMHNQLETCWKEKSQIVDSAQMFNESSIKATGTVRLLNHLLVNYGTDFLITWCLFLFTELIQSIFRGNYF